MLPLQVAGRHGSYATQFWKSSPAWTAVASRLRSRADVRVAYSRKALDRRLVLPLDSHNWIRALEVLNAGYARLGRTPEHFQSVLRDMVDHHEPYSSRVGHAPASRSPSSPADAQRTSAPAAASLPDLLAAVDALRDRAYAGEIPTNRSLWVTFVWAYCALDQPSSALHTYHLATRRLRFSAATTQHMAGMLLPVLCRHGQLEEATVLYESHLMAGGGGSLSTSSSSPATDDTAHPRSRVADAEARRWLAEAAARRGQWQSVQAFSTVGSGACSPGDAALAPRSTIHSLFHDTASTATQDTGRGGVRNRADAHPLGEMTSTAAVAATATKAVFSNSLPALHTLSPEAVRQLFRSLCRDGSAASMDASLHDALACWAHLYGPLPGCASAAREEAHSECTVSRCSSHDSHTRLPPLDDVHELLNVLAGHRRWEDALAVFCSLFLPEPAQVYLSATSAGEAHSPASPVADAPAALRSTRAPSPPPPPRLPLDGVSLNILFSALPAAAAPLIVRVPDTPRRPPSPTTSTTAVPSAAAAVAGVEEGVLLRLSASAVPVVVVRLLDDLLQHRDDMVLTDHVMAAVGPALLQLGQAERVFDLLACTPMMLSAAQRKAPVYVSREHHSLQSDLVTLGYAAFALCASPQRRHEMVRRLPHLFPPEVVRRFAVAGAGEGEPADRVASLEGPHVQTKEAGVGSAGSADAATHVSHNTQRDISRTDVEDGQAPSREARVPSLLDLQWRRDAASSSASSSQRRQARGAGGVAAQTSRRSGAATLTALADDAMRRDFVRLHERRRDAFTGSHADAERDPRPIPRGLHDHASGWDFFGRGGEMVFANHRRTPHPFTMQPKVMRDLRDPHRSWNPRRNSSLAHRENVIKWNGKSAV
ncbi:hypothetical protein NESM_000658900 [Novymonas esmeraldas]|uniref:Uncharacterized protein n=1 Tax=Novymonas esmeraldas TaxID=1808958 RepID=A0AAW0EUD0_9TRYP